MKKYFYFIVGSVLTLFVLLIWKSKASDEEKDVTEPIPEEQTPDLPKFVNDIGLAHEIYGNDKFTVRQIYGKYYYYPSTTSWDEVMSDAKKKLEEELAKKNLKLGDEMAAYTNVVLPPLPAGTKWKKIHKGTDGTVTVKIVPEDEQLAPSGWGIGSKCENLSGNPLPEILPIWTWYDKVTPHTGFGPGICNIYEVTKKK